MLAARSVAEPKTLTVNLLSLRRRRGGEVWRGESCVSACQHENTPRRRRLTGRLRRSMSGEDKGDEHVDTDDRLPRREES